jgi:HK97 family phage prohead protease
MGNNTKEIRAYAAKFETRANDDGTAHVIGQPVMYNDTADMFYFWEVIERGALDNTDLTDVLFFINHDDDKIPLARSRRNNGNSTMLLNRNDSGLGMESNIDVMRNSEAASLNSALERGDMDAMSFAFYVNGETWENLDTDKPTRRITSIGKITEVSAVNHPAYEGTWVQARDTRALESARLAVETARARAKAPEGADPAEEIRKQENELMLLKAKAAAI